MAKITINNRIVGICFVVLFVIVAMFLLLLKTPKPRHTSKVAMSKADVLAMYAEIGFLESDRMQRLDELAAHHGEQKNINSLLVQLLDQDHIYCPAPISNVDGQRVFVDPWGDPYEVAVITNGTSSNSFTPQVKQRISITSAHKE